MIIIKQKPKKRIKSKKSAQIQLNIGSSVGFESNDKIISIKKSINKKKIIKKKYNSHKLFNLLNKDEDISKIHKIKKIKLELKSSGNEKDNNNINLHSVTTKYNVNQNEIEDELKLDFNFEHLIKSNDDEIDKKEINNISFKQALRIDKRSFFKIFISVLTNQIDAFHLFFYINPYSHFSLNFSSYLFELLLDLTINCFVYTDDIVSEKYHNNGQLTILTSLTLSIISNITSSISVFIISKLTNYEDLIESIIKYVQNKRKFLNNLKRLLKYIKIRLGFYYFLQLLFILFMTYYLFIFCTVYHQSQRSIMINYIIGTCISLATSVGLTIIITILRVLSLKYKLNHLYNTSKYLYEKF